MEAENGSTKVFNVDVSDLQDDDVTVNGNKITGTVKYMDADNAITQVWGAGNFLTLKFSDIDERATSVKVGLDPSAGSGLAELINDPDKNGIFKISNKFAQKFVMITSDGKRSIEQRFDLSGLTLETS